MEQRGFKGVWIPKEIWLNTELSWSEKGLLVEIDSLNTSNGCWATNKHFSEFLGISENRVSHLISNLKEKGYIKVFIQYRDGTKQIEKRVIRTTDKVIKSPIVENNNTPIVENNNTYCRKQQHPIVENNNTPIVENDKDNKPLINNTINNTSNNMRKSYQAVKNDFEEVWKEYPNKKGKSKAFNAYQKAIADGVPHEVILQGVKSYAKECHNKRTNPEFIAHGSTWFGQRRWEDEYDNKVKEFKFGEAKVHNPTLNDLEAFSNLQREGAF